MSECNADRRRVGQRRPLRYCVMGVLRGLSDCTLTVGVCSGDDHSPACDCWYYRMRDKVLSQVGPVVEGNPREYACEDWESS